MKLDDPNIQITRDESGNIRHIDHTASPYQLSRLPKSGLVADAAAAYIKEVLDIKQVRTKPLKEKEISGQYASQKTESELWLSDEKVLNGLAIVSFSQHVKGLPLWHAGTTVILNADSMEVLEATNNFTYKLPQMTLSAKLAASHPSSLNSDKLSSMIALDKNIKRLELIRDDVLKRATGINKKALSGSPKIEISHAASTLFVYDPDQRKAHSHKSEHQDLNLVERALDLTLPAVDKSVSAGSLRAVSSTYFSTSVGTFTLNWHAMIDQATNSVLYIRALVEMAEGFVYDKDPLTLTGNTSITPSAGTAVLNGPRNPRPLANITALPNLTGQYVSIQDICPITDAPPTSASGRFDYNADTDDFAAVNAYYHNDFVFRMVEEMGFNMSVYFDGTTFPVPVDHRGSFACVNAAAWGNGGGNGIGFLTYGLVESGQPVGIATDVRIVLHEFGHVILLDHVNSGNLGFAHSCGDSMAALYGDPGSLAPDRGWTFPWLTQSNPGIDRRHDRDVATGWAWGGVNDLGGYDSEQILATSHFRAYLSLGGDHSDICEKEWASRYMLYLIIHTVGTLTPVTNPSTPEQWCDRMQLCDKVTTVFEGHAGGAVHKVIRWAFEQQGAYQPAGAPTPVTTPGAPPKYDIYINDGRNGGYAFTKDFCHTKDIWNRLCPDGNPAHQAPIPGIVNYAYVIVRNGGLADITGGYVHAYHKRESACCDCCGDCQDLRWPEDFKPTITQQLTFGPVAAGSYTIVGPFKWKPFAGDCLLFVAETKGDPSNIQFIDPSQSIETKRLVPFDNNIALRCICKQCNPDYSKLTYKVPCKKSNDPADPNDPADVIKG